MDKQLSGQPNLRGLGRGRVIVENLRRPGQFEIPLPEHMVNIEADLQRLDLSGGKYIIFTPNSPWLLLVNDIKTKCETETDIELLAEVVYKFMTKNKVSAQIGAVLSNLLGDFNIGKQKFRCLLLRKVQKDYDEREMIFKTTERFVQNAYMLCEVYDNLVLSNGETLIVLTQPILDYLEMLLRNETVLEMDAFKELLIKCHNDLRRQAKEGLEKLLLSVRNKICTTTSQVTRFTLLEVLEFMITSKKLSSKVEEFYMLSINKAKCLRN